MKTVQITRLHLENFKCHKALTLDFMGCNATLRGDNATGKTSVYDALTWLLFGKDSRGQGEKNIDIKPLAADGTVRDNRAETSVEAILTVDDVPITLRRTLREVWSTKRGSSEASFDGNTSDYSIDGVPMKKNEFDRRVAEIVSEDAFRALTNVSYFANELDWRLRRSVLFDVAGVVADRELLQLKPEFAPLAAAIGNLSLDDCKKKLLSEKRGLSGVRDTTPARLATLMEMEKELSGNDFDGARQRLATLGATKNGIMGDLSALEQNSAVVGKRGEIANLRTQLAKLDANNREHRATQAAKLPDTSGIALELQRLERDNKADKGEYENLTRTVARKKAEIAASRERWIAVNAETFAGGNCPTCGQALPMEQLSAAAADFERRKKERLAEIERTADGCKEYITAAEERFSTLDERRTQRDKQVAALNKSAAEAKKTAAAPIADLPTYATEKAELEQQIAAIETEIRAMAESSEAVREKLQTELTAVNAALAECNAIIGREATLQSIHAKMKALRADAAQAAEQLECIEKLLFAMEEFTRFKVGFVEGSINGMFHIVSFRLFREQANGGIEDRCDVVCGGVPYGSLNNGARINCGIDIIQALAVHFGVCVPLFVDNAESVTRLQEIDTQVIRLLVDENEKELRCNYEN